jgi:hypothetical protein
MAGGLYGGVRTDLQHRNYNTVIYHRRFPLVGWLRGAYVRDARTSGSGPNYRKIKIAEALKIANGYNTAVYCTCEYRNCPTRWQRRNKEKKGRERPVPF